MTNTSSLKGKVALITGGSRSIGKETALELAKRGADVIITYNQNQEAANTTISELEALGVKAHALQVNLTGTSNLASFAAKFKTVLQDWGREQFDILVNNAGVLRLATFDKVTEDDLLYNFQTNYMSVFFLTQKLMGTLADGGRIINLGSGTARIAFAPLVSYGPIKAALQSLTLYLASFLGSRNITVNAVAPGGLDTDFNANLFQNMPQARDYIASNTALGRVGVAGDVGSVIAFLASDDAAFISGAVINIDGGYHL